jgi:tetratricopeptide (TPR) repeat protein
MGGLPEDVLLDLDRAVALAPASGKIRVFRGIGLGRAGRYDEAIRELEVAASLDPLNASLRGGGVALTALGARRYDLAAREATLAAARDPGFSGWAGIAGIAHLLAGPLERCRELVPGGLGAPVRAICRLRSGRAPVARALGDSVEREVAAGRGTIYVHSLMGAYHAAGGDVAATLSWLERGFAASPTALDFRFVDAGLFDRVRSDPAFRRGFNGIMARVRERSR